jgi:hypothetical protein
LGISSGLRAITPALATSIYAAGVKYRIARGQLYWIVSVILACGLILVVRILPKKAEGKLVVEDDDEES